MFSPKSLEYKLFNWTSVVCAAAVVVFVLFLIVDRTSINLQTAIAFVDILRHILLVYTHSSSASVCSFLAFGSVLGDHLSLLFNVAIAANLQMIYIHGTIPSQRWQRLLYVVPVAFAAFIDLLPLVFGAYGLNKRDSCYLAEEHQYHDMFRILLFYATRMPGYIYCLTIFFTIMLKLYTTDPVDDEDRPLLIPNLQSRESRDLALRISFYPLSCVLCQSGRIAIGFFEIIGYSTPSFVLSWCFFGFSTVGIFNLVAFLFDPAVKQAMDTNPIHTPVLLQPTPRALETNSSTANPRFNSAKRDHEWIYHSRHTSFW
ncbi:hypothetical protein DSO57_1014503 [Entomophthora muscae]|uniref:Uncharacterized protein n=1 Tax=Entomophthora muscae TaxID=34485 RepID=A0ACC2SIL8_9FUNG|nr:hypothetical protein DSO57_1014503 [Entomophthora muscae]